MVILKASKWTGSISFLGIFDLGTGVGVGLGALPAASLIDAAGPLRGGLTPSLGTGPKAGPRVVLSDF